MPIVYPSALLSGSIVSPKQCASVSSKQRARLSYSAFSPPASPPPHSARHHPPNEPLRRLPIDATCVAGIGLGQRTAIDLAGSANPSRHTC